MKYNLVYKLVTAYLCSDDSSVWSSVVEIDEEDRQHH